MSTPIYHGGKEAKAFSNIGAVASATNPGSVPLSITGYHVAESLKSVEFETSLSGGFTLTEGTFANANLRLDGEYDYAANPFMGSSGAMSITQYASDGPNCANAFRVYLHTTNGAYWDFPSALIVGTGMGGMVNGKVPITWAIKANGVFVEPATSP
jgi:hypothetical protein